MPINRPTSPAIVDWMAQGPNASASRTPAHGAGGTGARQRRSAEGRRGKGDALEGVHAVLLDAAQAAATRFHCGHAQQPLNRRPGRTASRRQPFAQGCRGAAPEAVQRRTKSVDAVVSGRQPGDRCPRRLFVSDADAAVAVGAPGVAMAGYGATMRPRQGARLCHPNVVATRRHGPDRLAETPVRATGRAFAAGHDDGRKTPVDHHLGASPAACAAGGPQQQNPPPTVDSSHPPRSGPRTRRRSISTFADSRQRRHRSRFRAGLAGWKLPTQPPPGRIDGNHGPARGAVGGDGVDDAVVAGRRPADGVRQRGVTGGGREGARIRRRPCATAYPPGRSSSIPCP